MSDPACTLYIVATPIGTLSDISPRAKQILSSVEFVACEDTRRTKELLMALGLPQVPLVSLHEHNERNKSSSLIERLRASEKKTAALVSDAGTPAISDPGAIFVDACHFAGLRVESVPGPSSLVAAAAASGFLQPRLLFSGFLGRSVGEQIAEFKRWQAIAPCIAVCFESPNRITATMRTAASFFPPQTRVCLSREISKKFEEHLRGPISEILLALENGHLVKGECVLSFDLPEDLSTSAAENEPVTLENLVDLALSNLQTNPSAKLKDVTRTLAEANGINAKELYNATLARRRS